MAVAQLVNTSMFRPAWSASPCCRCRPEVISAPVAMALRSRACSSRSAAVSGRPSSDMLPAATRSATRPKHSSSSGRNTVRRATARPMPGSSGRAGRGAVPKAEARRVADGRRPRGRSAAKPGRSTRPSGDLLHLGMFSRDGTQHMGFWRGLSIGDQGGGVVSMTRDQTALVAMPRWRPTVWVHAAFINGPAKSRRTPARGTGSRRKQGQGSALDPPGGSGPLDPATEAVVMRGG